MARECEKPHLPCGQTAYHQREGDTDAKFNKRYPDYERYEKREDRRIYEERHTVIVYHALFSRTKVVVHCLLMATKVLYRKYRPSTFEQVVGQEHVIRTISNALEADKVAHAYLFTGPRGTGKTTTARLLARYLNCVGRPEGNKRVICEDGALCINCEALFAGNQPDLIEIDAASNRGIDEIRALREGIRFAPVQSAYKVFIVDEVHMLTKEAFNALLKTLEEPPSHAIFILATTEIQKVPHTVISRCQRFDFRRLALAEIRERLRRIAEQENVAIDDDALEIISLYADGSERDAESLLDQVMAFNDSHITRAEVAEVLGLIELPFLRSFVDALAEKNTARALERVAQAVERAYDMDQFIKALTQYLRDVLVLAVNRDVLPFVARRVGDEQAEAAVAHAQLFSVEQLVKFIERFLEAGQQIKYSPSPHIPIEVAVVELLNS